MNNWGQKRVISVAGGKGGIGKSSFVANLGVSLAQRNKKVVIIDADIGAANLHTLVGVPRPGKTLADFFSNSQTSLEKVVLSTPYPNLSLISSACDILSILSPNYQMNQKFFSALRKLDTEVVVFDIEAGTHHRAVDFFALAPIGIIIVEPLPTALENAYLFIKNYLFRFLLRLFYFDPEMKSTIKTMLQPDRMEKQSIHFDRLLRELEAKAPDKIAQFRTFFERQKYRLCIVANSVRDKSQLAIIDNFAKVVKRYLGLTPTILGYLPFELGMDQAIVQRVPFVIKHPTGHYQRCLQNIVTGILSH
ncbi:MAG: P-loop NTPase [Chitinispirillaceae bacterium]|nr:P-loop NTPase [Chitinispirillaceae bacterium]